MKLFICLWLLIPTLSFSQSLSFAPNADATLMSGGSNANLNFNGTGELRTDGNARVDFIIRFQVSGIGTKKVLSSKLLLSTINSAPVGGDFYVTSTNWGEGTVTFSNAPVGGAFVAKLGAVKRGTIASVDLSSVVKGDGIYSFRVLSTSSDTAIYLSRESSTGTPKLQIVTDDSISPSPSPTVLPSPSPTALPSPSPSPVSIQGIWLNKTEIMALPTTGGAWNDIVSEANSDWGTANLADNNASHDVKTLAGALYAARTGDGNMINKVKLGLISAMLSPLSRALELSRGLQSYIIAADLIGYQDADFKARVRELVYANIQGHSGTGLFGTATNCSNNWGGHARASLAAAALYLNDSVMLAAVRQGHLEFIGEWTGTRKFVYTNTGWHFDPNNKAGVNRADAGIFSGILPEDWRRDTSIDPANISSYNDMMSLNTVYSWEGMQGFVVAAAILHHAGIVPFSAGNGAVARAMDVLYKTNQPADGDDTWIPHLVNFYAGTTFPLPSSIQAGKGMGYTNWTHAR